MGASERRLGHDWERESASKLSKATGSDHSRNLIESRTGNTGDIVPATHNFLYQCKAGKLPPIYQALQQARDAAKIDGRIPIALIRRRPKKVGQPSERFAVIPMDEFLSLLADLYSMDKYKRDPSTTDFRS